jgi:hypothetical protein
MALVLRLLNNVARRGLGRASSIVSGLAPPIAGQALLVIEIVERLAIRVPHGEIGGPLLD